MRTASRPSTLPVLFAAVAAAALAGAAGCVDPDDPELDLAEDTEAISGSPLGGNPSNAFSGVMRVQIAGDPTVRTGVQIGADLVLTSSRWITSATSPQNVTVSNGTTGGSGVQTRTAAYITVNPYLPVAIIQTIQTFNTAPVVVDTRTAATLVSAPPIVNCYAYRTSADFRRAGQTIQRQDGARELITAPPGGLAQWLDDRDAGAPCFDSVTNTWIGFALSSNAATRESRIFAAAQLEFFLSGMRRVAAVRRNLGWPLPYMVQTVAPNGSRMCLDVPYGDPYDHAGLNQYPCHGGANQRWLLDYSHPGGPALVNVMTGTCIDIPGASQASGQAMQMYRCHQGPNQGWAWQTNAPGLPGSMLSPLSSPTQWVGSSRRYTLCMSVRGGASNTSRPIEQATCNPNAAHQDWYFGLFL